MHAASVNPEPGSNSLKNSISNAVTRTKYLFQSYFILASLLLCNEYSKFFNEIPSHFSVLLRNFFVVQFSMIKWLILRINPLHFSGFFAPSAWQPTYYTINIINCQHFFRKFFLFFELLFLFNKFCVFFCFFDCKLTIFKHLARAGIY